MDCTGQFIQPTLIIPDFDGTGRTLLVTIKCSVPHLPHIDVLGTTVNGPIHPIQVGILHIGFTKRE